MTTRDEHGPIWIVNEPTKPYPDGRFDGPAIPDASTPVWASKMGITPPLDPQQQAPEQIADAARLAVRDMETVFRKWGYIQAHPLPELRALLDMLTPPALKWAATEEDEHENEDSQSIVVAGQSVPYIIRDRGDMDVSMLPAQPARQANEDAERLTNLLDCIARGVTSRSDAVWLRETLLGWLQIVVARGERLGYIFATDEQPIIDALAELQL